MKTIQLDSLRRDYRDTISGSIARVGQTATFTATNVHRLATGDKVTISGATQSEYNGVFEVTVTTTTAFTFTVAGEPTTPATGSPVLRKNPSVISYADPPVIVDAHGRLITSPAGGIITPVSLLKTTASIDTPTRLHATEGVYFANRLTFWGQNAHNVSTGQPTDNTGDVYIGTEQFRLPIKVAGAGGDPMGLEFPHGIVDLYNVWFMVKTADDGVYVISS